MFTRISEIYKEYYTETRFVLGLGFKCKTAATIKAIDCLSRSTDLML